ncbi:hypothetical protein [Haliangium ochraceum]|uniref:Putative heat shock protein DnaJ, N-terminal n=1 Tax=Haliangium ochraceum (strain DSM 14365 / JCM 11303 / SMP-2) TaxID=502025 RepID=D0LHM2_HALO1|nr:hypothetical protein [Haliangium ochraceum]ACY12884.1 putative heat shock protein DnaJ, N-terminal [Haliangium ochraceum DSM 14365]
MDSGQRIRGNPFYVLGVSVEASRAEIEREGQKLLGMLALELSAATTYATPLGAHTRTVEAVREAMAELRDPDKRLAHELWARLPVPTADADANADTDAAAGADAAGDAPWPGARARLGWAARGSDA